MGSPQPAPPTPPDRPACRVIALGKHSRQLLRVGVSDSTPVAPVRKRYGKEAATGRGLLLIETMASAWGTEPNEGGKEVWFELTTLDEGQADVSTEAGGGATHDTSGVRTTPTAHTAPNRRRPPGSPRARNGRPPTRLGPATRR